MLAVSALEAGGPVEAFNLAHPHRALAENDLILSVNGLERDLLAMLDETSCAHVSLVVERPDPKEAALWAESAVDTTHSGLLDPQDDVAEDLSRDHIASRAKRWTIELEKEPGESLGASFGVEPPHGISQQTGLMR